VSDETSIVWQVNDEILSPHEKEFYREISIVWQVNDGIPSRESMLISSLARINSQITTKGCKLLHESAAFLSSFCAKY